MYSYSFLNKWFSDASEISSSQKLISKFLGQFSETVEQPIVYKLLESFIYINKEAYEDDVNDFVYSINEFISSLDGDVLVTLPFFSDGRIHNSYFNIQFNNINHFQLINSGSGLSQYKHIVFIDDYSGSGSTITNFVDLLINKSYVDVKMQKLYFSSIYITPIAVDKIETTKIIEYLKDIPIKHDCGWAKKLLNEKEEKIFVSLSNKFGVMEDYIKGKDGIEDLFSLYRYVPNDDIGIFWYKNQYRVSFPLFNRYSGLSAHSTIKYHSYDELDLLRNLYLVNDNNKVHRFYLLVIILYMQGYTEREIRQLLNRSSSDFVYKSLEFGETNKIISGRDIGVNFYNYYDKEKYFLYKNFGKLPLNNIEEKVKNNLIKKIT